MVGYDWCRSTSLTVMTFFSGRRCSSEAFLLPSLGLCVISTWEGIVNEVQMLARPNEQASKAFEDVRRRTSVM